MITKECLGSLTVEDVNWLLQLVGKILQDARGITEKEVDERIEQHPMISIANDLFGDVLSQSNGSGEFLKKNLENLKADLKRDVMREIKEARTRAENCYTNLSLIKNDLIQ